MKRILLVGFFTCLLVGCGDGGERIVFTEGDETVDVNLPLRLNAEQFRFFDVDEDGLDRVVAIGSIYTSNSEIIENNNILRKFTLERTSDASWVPPSAVENAISELRTNDISGYFVRVDWFHRANGTETCLMTGCDLLGISVSSLVQSAGNSDACTMQVNTETAVCAADLGVDDDQLDNIAELNSGTDVDEADVVDASGVALTEPPAEQSNTVISLINERDTSLAGAEACGELPTYQDWGTDGELVLMLGEGIAGKLEVAHTSNNEMCFKIIGDGLARQTVTIESNGVTDTNATFYANPDTMDEDGEYYILTTADRVQAASQFVFTPVSDQQSTPLKSDRYTILLQKTQSVVGTMPCGVSENICNFEFSGLSPQSETPPHWSIGADVNTLWFGFNSLDNPIALNATYDFNPIAMSWVQNWSAVGPVPRERFMNAEDLGLFFENNPMDLVQIPAAGPIFTVPEAPEENVGLYLIKWELTNDAIVEDTRILVFEKLLE